VRGSPASNALLQRSKEYDFVMTTTEKPFFVTAVTFLGIAAV
jgi:hypothetical protein